MLVCIHTHSLSRLRIKQGHPNQSHNTLAIWYSPQVRHDLKPEAHACPRTSRKSSHLTAFTLIVIALTAIGSASMQARERWTNAQAKTWASHQPFLTGGNFLPSNAINQLEMWQASTFDPVTIDRELGLGPEHRHENDARLPA